MGSDVRRSSQTVRCRPCALASVPLDRGCLLHMYGFWSTRDKLAFPLLPSAQPTSHGHTALPQSVAAPQGSAGDEDLHLNNIKLHFIRQPKLSWAGPALGEATVLSV